MNTPDDSDFGSFVEVGLNNPNEVKEKNKEILILPQKQN